MRCQFAMLVNQPGNSIPVGKRCRVEPEYQESLVGEKAVPVEFLPDGTQRINTELAFVLTRAVVFDRH